MGSPVNQHEHLVALCSRAAGLMAVRHFRSEASVTMFRATLASEFVAKSSAAQRLTPNDRFRRIIFPFKVEGDEIQDEVNPIWGNPAFILPAVVSLAWLFDAVLSPTRNASFTPVFERTDDGLYQVKLVNIVPSDRFDEARFNIMIAGACKAYYEDPDFLSLSRWALSTLMSSGALPEAFPGSARVNGAHTSDTTHD